MEIVIAFLVTLLLWGVLLVLTSMVWWLCLIIAVIVAVLGVYLGPELLN